MQLKFTLLIICLGIFCSFNNSCTRHVATSSISIDSKDAQGLISVQADGKGLTLPEREKDAQAFILREIIYNGVPSSKVSDVRLPLIENKSKLSTSQKSALDALLNSDAPQSYFATFTRHAATRNWNADNTRIERFSGQLRLDMLRKDLENKGIIRRFGY